MTKGEKSGNGISQYPCVSTELEHVVQENVEKPEVQPVRRKMQAKKTSQNKTFISPEVNEEAWFSLPIQVLLVVVLTSSNP